MSAITLSAPVLGAAPRLPFLDVRSRFQPLQRRQRQPFAPSSPDGPYKLPRKVQEPLQAALAPYRNRQAAFALAVFLARFWSAPGRLERAFPVDRRALADHQLLGLSEAEIRGAIRTLERVGFLDRPIPTKGSSYQRKGDALHRKPMLFVFGSEHAAEFAAANQRAEAKRQAHSPKPLRTASPVIRSPKEHSKKESFLTGQIRNRPSEPTNEALENALASLKKAIGIGDTA